MITEILKGLVVLGVPSLFCYAAWRDLRDLKIPANISGALLALYGLAAFSWQVPPDVFLSGLACGAVFFAIGFGLWAVGLLGGGDVRLNAAAGLFVGFSDALPYVMATVVAGGALSLAALFLRRRLPGIVTLPGDRESVPFGVAIALGFLVVEAAGIAASQPLG